MSKQPTPKADALRAMRERGKRRPSISDAKVLMADATERAAVSATKAAAKRAARKHAD